jgi:hypothetical protein
MIRNHSDLHQRSADDTCIMMRWMILMDDWHDDVGPKDAR